MQTLIIALGGNALIKEGQKGTIEEQLRNIKKPIGQIVKLHNHYRLVITHGNGPQVGNILLQQATCDEVPNMPLEVLVAMTQGQIGYMIEKTLDNEFMKIGVMYPFLSTLITYVQVDKKDPAIQEPTKPVGPIYDSSAPGFIKTAKGWRKAVPSPKPVKVVGAYKVKKLLDSGFVVVTCGGGGIPAVKEDSSYEGVEAVIDKDLASAKLGEQIGADILLIATDVEKVFLNYGKKNQKAVDKLSVSDARKYLKEGHFPKGSMGPKIQAAINFITSGGKRAIITSIDNIEQALKGKAGTEIHK